MIYPLQNGQTCAYVCWQKPQLQGNETLKMYFLSWVAFVISNNRWGCRKTEYTWKLLIKIKGMLVIISWTSWQPVLFFFHHWMKGKDGFCLLKWLNNLHPCCDLPVLFYWEKTPFVIGIVVGSLTLVSDKGRHLVFILGTFLLSLGLKVCNLSLSTLCLVSCKQGDSLLVIKALGAFCFLLAPSTVQGWVLGRRLPFFSQSSKQNLLGLKNWGFVLNIADFFWWKGPSAPVPSILESVGARGKTCNLLMQLMHKYVP